MVAQIHQYSVYGLTLRSELALRLPREFEGSTSKTVVELVLAKSDAFLAIPEGLIPKSKDWFQHLVLKNGALYMRWENMFDFIIAADGAQVLCRKLANEVMESFEAYLTTFALSSALLQQGEEPLHATVIEIDGHSIGLIGPSGAGKSTLAAFLISQGGGLITDDMLRIYFENGAAMAYPGPYRLKLFREPAKRFLAKSIERGQFNPFSGKYIFQPNARSRIKSPRKLSAVYFLDSSETHSARADISVDRLTGVELFKIISAATMNSRLNMPVRLERQFRFAERLASTVPFYRLVYPRDYGLLDEVCSHIRQTWQ